MAADRARHAPSIGRCADGGNGRSGDVVASESPSTAGGRGDRTDEATGVPLRPGRHPRRQRLPTRARLAGGARRRAASTLSVWRIHRKIGMSGGLFANALLRETGRADRRAERLGAAAPAARARRTGAGPRRSGRSPARSSCSDGSTELGVPWAIATSGTRERGAALDAPRAFPTGCPSSRATRSSTPSPTLTSSCAAAERLGVTIEDSVVVGDSVWDLLAARRARALGVGLLSGGYGHDELERAGAYRVYRGSGRPARPPRRGRASGPRASSSCEPPRPPRPSAPVGRPVLDELRDGFVPLFPGEVDAGPPQRSGRRRRPRRAGGSSRRRDDPRSQPASAPCRRSSVRAVRSAPPSSNADTHVACPCTAARISGVLPSSSVTSSGSPFHTAMRRPSRSPQ